MLFPLWLACTSGDPADDVQTDDDPCDVPPPVTDLGPVEFPEGAAPRNVLIPSVDTLRRDGIGRYGGHSDTPFIDSMLAEAVALDDHRSCADWTSPSMTCILTGLFPPAHGFWPVNNRFIDVFFPEDVQSIPKLLGEQGFGSTLVTASPTFEPNTLGDLLEGFGTVVSAEWETADVLSDLALTEADTLAASGAPWLLHVHYIDPHAEYCPPAEWIPTDPPVPAFTDYDLCLERGNALIQSPNETQEWRDALTANLLALYRGEIRFFDHALGEFWAELDARGLLDDTLVLFVSDHGEQFFEHDAIAHDNLLYLDETAVVAAFWAKGLEPTAWTGPTTHVDLFATIGEVYGVTPPTPFDGIPVGSAPQDRIRLSVQINPELSLFESFEWSPAVFSSDNGAHSLHTNWDVAAFELYDLVADPGETTNVWSADDPTYQALWGPLQPLALQVKEQWPDLIELDP